MKNKNFLRLNIQMFAENEGENVGQETENTPKTYSQEEYQKLVNEIAKQKSIVEKTNAENKKYKDAERARLSEEEQKKLEQEDKDKRFAEMETKLRKSELTSLLAGSFSTEHTSKLVEAITESKSDNDLAKLLCDIKKQIIDETTKSIKSEIRKGTYLPDGSTGDTTKNDFGKELAMQFGKKPNKAMEYFDNLRKNK